MGHHWVVLSRHAVAITLFDCCCAAGMNHASQDLDGNGVVDATDIEYGDSSDPLGSQSNFKRFNAVHRYEKGWFHAANIGTNLAGAVTLTSASVVGSTPSALGLIRLTRSTMTDSYWISLRTAYGPYDSTLPSDWANVVYVHRWASGNTKMITRLAAGQYFNDIANNMSVTVNSIDTVANTAALVLYSTAVPIARPRSLLPLLSRSMTAMQLQQQI